MKTFRSDIQKFKTKIANKENFTLSKYADGEWAVMQNHKINNKEFWFDPDDEQDKLRRKLLLDSFKYKNKNYYVGISCPCCQGIDTFNEMKNESNQDDEHLTWANLWVNSNYKYYVENIIPLFKERNVVLFCNKKAKIYNLPFKPWITFTVENNAWGDSFSVLEEAKFMVSHNGVTDALFLFCCGPFGNILAHQLTVYNQSNTYLDVGSTLNPWLKSEKFKRLYYCGNNAFSNLICTWG